METSLQHRDSRNRRYMDGNNHGIGVGVRLLGRYKTFLRRLKMMRFVPIYLIQIVFFSSVGVMAAHTYMERAGEAQVISTMNVLCKMPIERLGDIEI